MKHLPLAVAALAVMLAAAWTVAQDQPPPPPPPGVQEPPQPNPPDGKGLKHPGAHPGKDGDQAKAREMLEQVMIARLSGELKLTDEQSVLLMRRFTEARAEKQTLNRDRTEAIRNLRGIVEQQKDEAALNECLARLHDADAKLASHRQRLQETMGADLSPWQKGKLVLFLDQFENDIRQTLREARERRNGRPMGPMGPMGGMMPGMQPGGQPDMQPGMRPGMNPQGFGRIPMQPGPKGMRPPQGPPQEPPQAPPQLPAPAPAPGQ